MDNTENLSVSEVQPSSSTHLSFSQPPPLDPLENNLNVASTSSENKLETGESHKLNKPKGLKDFLYEQRQRARQNEINRQLGIRKIVLDKLKEIAREEKEHVRQYIQLSKFVKSECTKEGQSIQLDKVKSPDNLSYKQRQRAQIKDLKKQLKARKIVAKKLREIIAKENKHNREIDDLIKLFK